MASLSLAQGTCGAGAAAMMGIPGPRVGVSRGGLRWHARATSGAHCARMGDRDMRVGGEGGGDVVRGRGG